MPSTTAMTTLKNVAPAPVGIDFEDQENLTSSTYPASESSQVPESPVFESADPEESFDEVTAKQQPAPKESSVVAYRRNNPYLLAHEVYPVEYYPPTGEFSLKYQPKATAFVDLPKIAQNPRDWRNMQLMDLAHRPMYDQACHRPDDIALLHLQNPKTMKEANRLKEKFFTNETFFNTSCPHLNFKPFETSGLLSGLSRSQFNNRLKRLEDHLVTELEFVPLLVGQITFEYGGLACLAFILQMLYPGLPPAKIVPVYIKKDDCLRLYVHRSMVNHLLAAHRCRLLCDRHGWLYLAQSYQGADILAQYGNHQQYGPRPTDRKVSRFPITIELREWKKKNVAFPEEEEW